MNLVHNDYIKSQGRADNFSVSIDPPGPFTNYFESSCRAVQIIADNRQGPLFLMYSGGVDSEYTLSLFRHLGIAIKPVIIKLLPNYNSHDLDYALKYCQRHNIDPIVYELDFDWFVNTGRMYTVATLMKSSKYHYAATAHVINQLNGTVICGDGEPYIRIDPATKQWNLMVHEYEYALSNHFKLYSIRGTPHFNRYTKEMFYSFLTADRMKDLAANLVPGKTSSFSSKWIVYNQHSGFNLEERPKYHGYETVEQSKIFNHESFRELEQIGQKWDGAWSVNYFDFIKQCTQ